MRAWALVLLVACGGDDVAPTATPDAVVFGDTDGGDGDAAIGGGTALSHTLFVNAEGVTLTVGADDATTNTSALLAGPSATLPKFLAADAQRATKIGDIKAQLDGILSPYHVTVTLTRPAAGPYDMVVLTDDNGQALGMAGSTTAVPSSCNSVASEIGFQFSGDTDRNHVVRNVISMFGVTAGIPTSNRAHDCMCLDDTNCATLDNPCTIGIFGTAVSTQSRCPTNSTTDDENALFLASFGAH